MRRIPRLLAGTVAVLVLLPACGASRTGSIDPDATPDIRSFGDPSLLDDDPGQQPGTTAGPAGGGDSPAGGGGTAQRTAPPDVTAAPSRTLPPPRPRDDGQTGSNAKLYLQPTAPKLIVEMGAVTGKQPTQAALDHVKRVLERVLDKPGGVELRLTETFAADKDVYSIQDIARIEEKYRQAYSDERQAVMYLLFLNGRAENASALGIAWRASSIVIFTDQIRNAVTAVLPSASIEKAVIVHEVGHLLSLVNLTYQSPRDHEDPEHEGHSKHRDSVMYYAIETVSIGAVFGAGPPDDFHRDDLADLDDLKSNRL